MTTTTTTTIIVYTSAADAVLQSCQHGWHRVEVDTSTWPANARSLLAQSVHEKDGARYTNNSGRDATPSWSVAPPTAEGLLAHVQARIEHDAKEAAEQAARQAAKHEAVRSEHEAADAVVRAEVDRLRALPLAEWFAEGAVDPRECSADCGAVGRVCGSEQRITADLIGRADVVAEAARRKAARLDAARALLAGTPWRELESDPRADAVCAAIRIVSDLSYVAKGERLAQILGRVDDRETYLADRKAQMGGILEAIDPSLLPRWREDVLPERELKNALRSLLRPAFDGVAGDDADGWRNDWDLATELSADAHAALVRVRKAAATLVLPGGSEAEVWADSRTTTDDDGELWTTRVRVAVCATICGVRVTAGRIVETT